MDSEKAFHRNGETENSGEDPGQYFLGIDIGTTSVKVCLIDGTGNCISECSTDTNADVVAGELESCQDVLKILAAVENCVQNLDASITKHIGRIGICGQMHGVCMWKYQAGVSYKDWKISSLYTWMDRRCNTEFLMSLPHPNSHLKLSSGHGCATLFWISRFQNSQLDDYDSAGTIMDLLVAIICDLSKPVMSNQNAGSWGYFDTKENKFNNSGLEAAQFPTSLLPTILCSNSIAGTLRQSWLGIKPGTPVGVALGDLQCSVYATMSHYRDSSSTSVSAFINFSTSAQIGYVTTKVESRSDRGVAYFPFFDKSYLAVGASLNGGKVLAMLVDSVHNLLRDFNLNPTKDDVWSYILEAGRSTFQTDLLVSPVIFGERHSPDAKGWIGNISPSSSTLGHLTRGICKGLVENLAQFIPPHELSSRKITRIIGSGSALNKNSILRDELCAKYPEAQVIFTEQNVSAAYGIAAYQRVMALKNS